MNAHRRRDYRGRLLSPFGVGMFPARPGGTVYIDTVTFDGTNYEVNGVDGGTGNVVKIAKATGVGTFLATPVAGSVTVTAVGYGGKGAGGAGAGGTGGGGDTLTLVIEPWAPDPPPAPP